MTATKFITFGIGCLLLLPFIWSFVLMVLPPPQLSDEEQTVMKSEKARMEAEQKLAQSGNQFVMGFTSVTTYKAVTPHPKLMFVWLLASRWWVGVMGLSAVLVLIFCLFISSFFPIIVESFGYEHHVQMEAPTNLEMGFQIDDLLEKKSTETDKPKTGK